MLGALIGGTIGSLFGIASGLMQEHHANVLDGQSVRPVYQAPSEIALNQDLTQRQADQGMSGTSYNNDLNNINRNESAGLNTLSQDRNSLSGIGNLVAHSNDAALSLDSQDDAIKKQNMTAYLGANKDVADYKDKAFQYNQADLYAQQQAKIASYRSAGQASVSNGISGLASMGMSSMMGSGSSTPKS